MRTNRILDGLVSRLPSTVVANITDFAQYSPTLARVVVAFNAKADPDKLARAVCAAFNNEATPVPGTFRFLTGTENTAVGFVTANTQSMPYEAANVGSMVALAGNMLMDSTDESLWKVHTSHAGDKVLVRQGTNELTAILETAKMRVRGAIPLSHVAGFAGVGEFAAFVHPETLTLGYGYVVASELELPPGDFAGQEAVEILPMDEDGQAAPSVVVPTELVIESANLNGSDRLEAVAAPVAMNKQALIDYYTRIYSRISPDYLQKVVNIIDNHAAF